MAGRATTQEGFRKEYDQLNSAICYLEELLNHTDGRASIGIENALEKMYGQICKIEEAAKDAGFSLWG